MEIRNAKIDGTFLGYEDHGIFTVTLTLNYGGAGQGFQVGALDDKPIESGGNRPGTAWGHQVVIEILKTVGVDRWEDLKGKYVRVAIDDGLIQGIGNVLEDKWFYPKQLFKEFETKAT